jgi:hypothetical protein
VALVGLAAMAAQPALAQPRLDYRTADPRALLQAWKTVPPEERGALATAMVARRAQVLPYLWDAVRFGDQREKLFACAMIADVRDRDGVDALLVATSDSDVKVRRRAATALRILADPRSAARLRELVRSEPDLGVLRTSLAALGKLGQRSDRRLVEPFLTHADAGVRVVAAGALAMLGDERGLDIVLAATTSSDDPEVQKSATYALGLFGAAAAGDRLQAILANPYGAWKSYALIAVAERKLATQTPTQQVATLEPLVVGRSRTLAEWAVDHLTDIGNPAAIAALRKARTRSTPVAALAERRLILLGAQP